MAASCKDASENTVEFKIKEILKKMTGGSRTVLRVQNRKGRSRLWTGG